MSRQTTFVVLTTQRSGSAWLVDLLNAHPDVVAYAEMFRVTDQTVAGYGASTAPRFEAVVPRGSYAVSKTMVGRRYAYVRGLARAHVGARAVGFKLMYDQTRDHAGLLELLALRRCRVVHLVRRDHLRALVSFDLATARGAWHHYQGDVWRGTQVRIDPSRLVRRIEDREAEIAHFRRRLRRLLLRTMEVQYERLVERRDEELRSIFEFLGVPSAETAVSSTMLPSAVPSLADAIENVDEVRSALSKTRFAPQLAAIT